ncbi:MAG: DUF3396 domain-containing protein [Pseudomonadota bacterium]|nr:DUF3396 domain-containing protein [Pseudomonadota bacterium]
MNLTFAIQADSPPVVAILPGLEVLVSVRLGCNVSPLISLWERLFQEVKAQLTYTYDNTSKTATPLHQRSYRDIEQAFKTVCQGYQTEHPIPWATYCFTDAPEGIAHYSCTCALGWITSANQDRGLSLRLTVPPHYPWAQLTHLGYELARDWPQLWRWITVGYRFVLVPWYSPQLEDAFLVLYHRSKRFVAVDIGDYFGLLASYWQNHLRTINYLTIISDDLLNQCHIDPLAPQALFQKIPIENHMAFQIGEKPILGDINRREQLSGYQAVNQMLKPICTSESVALPPWNLETTMAWLNRFD